MRRRFMHPIAAPTASIANQGRETFDATAYLGLRLWHGAELWINPEIDQGFGLSGTLGVAGFTSGEAYKVGADLPLRAPCTARSSGRPSISAARRRKWTPASTSLPAARRPTAS